MLSKNFIVHDFLFPLVKHTFSQLYVNSKCEWLIKIESDIFSFAGSVSSIRNRISERKFLFQMQYESFYISKNW